VTDAEAARHLQNLIFAFGVVGIGCFTAIVTTWIRYRARRVVSSESNARFSELADSIAKLDNAVEAMAIEVERISEGQRFVTKVLAERSTTPALPDQLPAGVSKPRL
jgi:hypothetical protein